MSKIEWTDQTWNPITGCTRVSEGCRHCYAETMAARLVNMGGKAGEKYEGTTWHAKGGRGKGWTGVTRFHPDTLAQPLRWKKPRRVFVCSMSDLFHENNRFEWIAAIFGVMAATPHITYQVLTKRPERALEWFEWTQDEKRDTMGGSWDAAVAVTDVLGSSIWNHVEPYSSWPLPNVHLGVSVEDQATADARIPILLGLSAAVRWVSYEPALEQVSFRWAKWEPLTGVTDHLDGLRRLDWIVAGAESGPGARPAELAWFKSVRDQCAEAGVPFFMKQITKNGRKVAFDEWPEDLRVREFPT